MITLSMAFLVGIATHLVKKSVAVKIHLFFPEEDGFISPMKSKPHYLKGELTAIDFKGNATTFVYQQISDKGYMLLPADIHMKLKRANSIQLLEFCMMLPSNTYDLHKHLHGIQRLHLQFLVYPKI